MLRGHFFSWDDNIPFHEEIRWLAKHEVRVMGVEHMVALAWDLR